MGYYTKGKLLLVGLEAKLKGGVGSFGNENIGENIFTSSFKLLSGLKLVTNSLRNTITRFLLDNEKNN